MALIESFVDDYVIGIHGVENHRRKILIPLVVETRSLAQIAGLDQVQKQVDIDQLRNLFGALLLDLTMQGFNFKNEDLLTELNNFLNNQKR